MYHTTMSGKKIKQSFCISTWWRWQQYSKIHGAHYFSRTQAKKKNIRLQISVFTQACREILSWKFGFVYVLNCKALLTEGLECMYEAYDYA